MDKCIPPKITSTGNNLPWLHTQLRRMIKKKQSMYNIAKMSKKSERLGTLWHTHTKETRKTLRWNSRTPHRTHRKQCKTFLEICKINKTRKHNSSSTTPKDGEFTIYSSDKVEILNDEFKSVFTLRQKNEFPSMEGPKCTTIDNPIIQTKGDEKLLQKT